MTFAQDLPHAPLAHPKQFLVQASPSYLSLLAMIISLHLLFVLALGWDDSVLLI
jgi:hypothetical protein